MNILIGSNWARIVPTFIQAQLKLSSDRKNFNTTELRL